MDIVKVNVFIFLNDEAEEFTSRSSQSLVDVRSPSYLKQETFKYCLWDYIFSFSFDYVYLFLVWVKYMVKYIHIGIKLLIHDKLKR